jgi:hypothetical protein
MPNFRQALFSYVSPKLKAQGYEYDDALRDRNILYGFKREIIPKNFICTIEFQRNAYNEKAVRCDFQVILGRHRIGMDLRKQNHGFTDEVSICSSLYDVLQSHFNIQQIPEYQLSWLVKSPDEYASIFNKVLSYIEQFGIPWLENSDTRDLTFIYPEIRQEFKESVGRIIIPELFLHGFQLDESNNKSQTTIHFIKNITEMNFAHIDIHIGKGRNSKMVLTTNLVRNTSPDSRFQLGEKRQDLYIYGLRLNGADVEPGKPNAWVFSNQEEIDVCLKEVLLKLEEYGMAFLELV